MRLPITLTTIAFLLSACGNADSGSPFAYRWTKNIYAVWSDPTKTLDLSRARSGATHIDFTFQDGSICRTNLNVLGQQSAGNMTITTSIYAGGGSGDPGCAALIETYAYQNPTGFALEVCNSLAICTTYK